MSHAFIALSSAALTYFITGTAEDGYRAGAAFLSVLAGLAAIGAWAMERTFR